ncbi:hypothetical protein EF888_17005 [Silicimonas algicola]|uniref:Uncharacterized protein n=1 Tax=Silicimonas algicola TaxID=1826607 RepID=A0A316G8E3_9RHOB|nr:hypothetical protein [Silicimonas algicola]AZQ68677.1 hypothetical protein EF888_17005 [Silicimonas algicola]PWK56256.1 hypothetical protein C8D95_105324 [Silicimonas algicola]
MTLKDRFSSDDWSRVLEAPMLAGFSITAADPGGLISAVQESAAMAGSLRLAAKDGGEGSLAHAVAEAYTTSEGRSAATDGLKSLVKGKRPAEASDAAVSRLGEIMALVERTVPEHAAGFRKFLIDTATKTAEASTEGGFLGFGGARISEAEHKTLAQLRTALGGPVT